jgi:hypothetical protein
MNTDLSVDEYPKDIDGIKVETKTPLSKINLLNWNEFSFSNTIL